MLVVLANRHDAEARALVESWGRWDAGLLTSADLSRSGWRHDLRRPAAGWAVIGGRRVAVAEVSGVLVRWPAVFDWELEQILSEERPYVAAEMTAFLRSWLTELRCPVLNAPTSVSLSGPGWRPERWVHAAAQLGVPVRPVRRRVPGRNASHPPEESTAVTVVGSRCFGDAHADLAAYSLRLADAAGVGLLRVHFDDSDRSARMVTADPLPDLGSEEVSDAVLSYLLDGENVRSFWKQQ